MPIRIKRSFFYFKLNIIVEIRLLAKFDYCTIGITINESRSYTLMSTILKGDVVRDVAMT